MPVYRIIELINGRDTKGLMDLVHDDYERKVWEAIRREFIINDKLLKEKYFGNDGGSALNNITYGDARKLLEVLRLR